VTRIHPRADSLVLSQEIHYIVPAILRLLIPHPMGSAFQHDAAAARQEMRQFFVDQPEEAIGILA